MASGLKKNCIMIPLFLFHGIKIIHTCFLPNSFMVSVLQSTESKSRQIPKFAREQGPALRAAWVRPLGIAEERAFSRSCPGRGDLRSSRPPVCCLGLRALPGREPAPRRTLETGRASGRSALRSGRPTVGVRPGPCAPLVGSHPAAAMSRSLPEQRRRLARGLRFGRRARGRAPEAGGDSGNVPGAVRPEKSLQVRGLGGRRRSVSLPGPVDQRAARPLLHAGTAGAAEREQERSRRWRPRCYTFSMFPTLPEVRTTRMHADTSSLPSLPRGPR